MANSQWLRHGQAMASYCSLDCHIRIKRIDLAIKLHLELRFSRRRYWDMQNCEVDLFMMVSRPSKANLGGRKPKYCRRKFLGRKLVEIGSRPDYHGYGS